MTSALVPIPAPAAPTQPSAPPAGSCLPPRIHAICLDIDDTLIDFTASARMALAILIGRDDMWGRWQRVTDEFVAMAVAGEMDYDTMRRARTKAFLADLGALVDDEAVAVLEDRRLARMSSAWQLFADAVPCLDWLRAAGFKIAAVTNASGPHQRAKLAGLGLARFFDTVVIGGELGAAKPDPMIFHEACDQLGVPADQAVHIGDRLDLDAVGARDAGLHAVWLDRPRPARQHRAADCDEQPAVPGVHVIESLAELPELLVGEFLTPAVGGPSGVPAPRG